MSSPPAGYIGRITDDNIVAVLADQYGEVLGRGAGSPNRERLPIPASGA
jgi:hypothetical protein